MALTGAGKLEEAAGYYQILEQKFGKASTRLQKLAGLTLEANGDFDGALQLYQRLIESQPADTVRNRIFALLSS